MQQLTPVALYGQDFDYATYTSGGGGDLGGTFANVFVLIAPVTKVRFLFKNYSLTGGGEVITGLSTVTVQASVQAVADTGTPVQLTFGGQNSVTIAPGEQTWSDFVALTGVVGQQIGQRTFVQVPSTGVFPRMLNSTSGGADGTTGLTATSGSNYAQYTSGNGSNQILTAGAVSTWRSQQFAPGYGAERMEGIFSDNITRPIIGGAGDGTLDGIADDQGYGGYFRRLMYALNLPYILVAQQGENLASIYQGNTYGQRFNAILDSTAIVWNYGAYDFNGGVSSATQIARSLSIWQKLAAKGASIIPATVCPRPSYTGNIYPVSQQTASTANAQIQAYNAWLRAPASAGTGNSAIYDARAVGVNIPFIFDIASYVETNASNAIPGGPSAPYTAGLWYCGPGNNAAYSDGINPNTLAVKTLLLPVLKPFAPALLATAAQQQGLPTMFSPSINAAPPLSF